MRGLTRQVVAGLLVAVSSTSVLGAQGQTTLYRTRQWLDSVATATEQAASRAKGSSREALQAEARALRERLSVGDFYPGDRIVIELYGGEEAVRDTVVAAQVPGAVVQLLVQVMDSKNFQNKRKVVL